MAGRLWRFGSASLISLALLGMISTGATARAAGGVPAFGHVFVIVGENKALSQIRATNAPYIMKTLKPAGAWFTDYNHVVKGSLADYIALTSGQFDPCQAHGPCGVKSVPSIFSQVGSGNWRDWNESMPRNCYTGYSGSTTNLNAYKPGHNPAVYYANIPCATYDIPAGTTGPDDMSSFNRALAAGSVPEYNFVSPNLCEDSYHSCNGANIVTEYDDFLKKEIPLIEKSPAFGADGVIFVTYDEANRHQPSTITMMIVLGAQVRPGTYTGHFDHYSTVATVEAGLGLPCLANACQRTPFPIF